jgi:hypothetical protein
MPPLSHMPEQDCAVCTFFNSSSVTKMPVPSTLICHLSAIVLDFVLIHQLTTKTAASLNPLMMPAGRAFIFVGTVTATVTLSAIHVEFPLAILKTRLGFHNIHHPFR